MFTQNNLYSHFLIYSKNQYIPTFLDLSQVSSYMFNGRTIFVSDIDTSLVQMEYENQYEPFFKLIRQNVYSPEDNRSAKNAINIGLVGLQTVGFSLIYERLINQKYAIVFSTPIINTNKGKERGFCFNYRNHFKNTMNSGYWGIFANYSKIEGKVEATGFKLDEYKFTNQVFVVGPNIGKRWIDKAGMNFSVRFGYGIKLNKKFEWIDIPEDDAMKDMGESMMKIVAGFDAEISVGYCF